MPARQPPPEQNDLRVLVVDDDRNIADVLSMALRYEGYSVEVADSGSAALKAASPIRTAGGGPRRCTRKSDVVSPMPVVSTLMIQK